ncbi:MAG TPA: M23 family metallopeptidase [Candidatus Acidoferrales bacterium]|nr:M23 family metallopeptidase [Candidatus Acidoferrales bacterium]
MKFIIIALVLIVAVPVAALLLMSSSTVLTVQPDVKVIGLATPVKVQIANPHGVRRVSAHLEQNGVSFPLLEQTSPSHRLFWRRNQPPETVTFEAGRNKAPNLKEGDARLVVETGADDFRGSSDTTSVTVKVILAPPRVTPDDAQHYINQGGMELAVLTPGGSWSEAGVKVAQYTFRSFPLPGHPDQRFAMFAYSWDLPADVTPMVYARNQAGTEATARFWFRLFPKKFRTRDLPIDDAFIQKVVSQIDPDGSKAPGPDMLSRFLKMNGEMRRQNNQQLADLRFKTEEKILWNGPFLHWGKEESMFADVRNYMYQGKKVDRQVHLGFDLSDLQNAPVHVANDGRVVWAADLGIYGNCVVVDHGYALQSIYGHMNRIDVKVGDRVTKNQSLGVAGQTGMAGGVHVHFSMQIDGVQINPKEWWDEHWIHDRIMSKLDPNAPPADRAPVEAQSASAKGKAGGKHKRRK